MLFMSVWRKVPDMSVIATSLLSFASIVHHNIKASNKLAGKTVFFLCCKLKLGSALIVLFLSLVGTLGCTVSFLFLVSCLLNFDSNPFWMCSCFSAFSITAFPF